MDYYLYSHSNANGIFYIGKGSKKRKNDYINRSKGWKEAGKGYEVKVEARGTEKDIFALEGKVIKSLVEQGVNLINKIHNPNWECSDETRRKLSKASSDYHKRRLTLTAKQQKRKKERLAYWSHIRSATAFK